MIVRSSSYTLARFCERAFYYKYILGLEPNVVKRNDLYFGTALHSAVHNFHSGKDPMEPWDSYNPQMSTKEKNPHVGRVLTKMYAKNPLNIVETEKPFEFFIGKHKWKGRFDGIVELSNSLYVAEHKTTKWGYRQIKPNDQLISYVLGGRVYYQGIDSTLVNVFNVSKMTIERKPVSFTKEEIDDWLSEVKIFLSYLTRCIHTGIYPKSTNCYPYNHECEYKCICNSHNSEPIIRRAFHVNEEHKNLDW
jgi:hypothetical protein